MTIFGDGEQLRAFSYIEDVAPLIARGPLIAAARNQVFNIGADKPHSLNSLATAVHDAMRSQGLLSKTNGHTAATDFDTHAPPIRYLPKRVEVDAAFANHSKLRCFFHPPTPVPLDEGLRRMARWLGASTGGDTHRSGAFSSKINAVEVRQHLPPSWDHDEMMESDYIQELRPIAQTFSSSSSEAHLDEQPCPLHSDTATSGVGLGLLPTSPLIVGVSLFANLVLIAQYCCRKHRYRSPRLW